MFIDYEKLIQTIIGTSILKPASGTLSGHAAGGPFDNHVYAFLKKQNPKNTFRQFEYLNDLYSKNPMVIGYNARRELFDSPTVLFLLSRSKNATDKWSIENPFLKKSKMILLICLL